MTAITTIGLDLAKKVFQVHGVDAEGKVVVARKLRRKEVLTFFARLAPCLVGMEACGSAHLRHDQDADGRHALLNEDAAEGCHRDGVACACLQFDTCTEYRRRQAYYGGG